MKILVLNCGSSSLKYQLIDMEGERVLAKGLCERIGIDGRFQHTGKAAYKTDAEMKNHTEAIRIVIEALLDKEHGVLGSIKEINAVGHRVVHGGEFFSQSVIITDDVIKAIDECSALAPLHNPANLMGIRACEEQMPGVPQVAVFDTAFHQTMPPKAYLYAIPYEYYEKYKIRRYGFHGTSHRYVTQRAAVMLKKPLDQLKLISCHLGNGASVCAVAYGKSIDTSMGLTPLAGLAMGTRSGNLDPAVIEFLADKENLNIEQVENILNKKSGMLGLSGVSSDFRDIKEAEKQGNMRAKVALELFHYRVAKSVGGYAAALNGADAIIFTAGLGENSGDSRSAICKYFGYLGLHIDEEKNNIRGVEADVSTDGSTVRALVIPTNEELMIARDAAWLLA